MDGLVYLSAVHILHQEFSGKRLDEITRKYSQAMTNFWPYLRLRRHEKEGRKRVYASSFVQKLDTDGRVCRISSRLWGSPDNEKQVIIAVR